MSIIGVDHTRASLAYLFWSMPEKYPQRRHKILKAIPFMVSGVADDETRFDRCGVFCRRGGNKNCPNGCRNAPAHASQGRCGVADILGGGLE